MPSRALTPPPSPPEVIRAVRAWLQDHSIVSLASQELQDLAARLDPCDAWWMRVSCHVCQAQASVAWTPPEEGAGPVGALLRWSCSACGHASTAGLASQLTVLWHWIEDQAAMSEGVWRALRRLATDEAAILELIRAEREDLDELLLDEQLVEDLIEADHGVGGEVARVGRDDNGLASARLGGERENQGDDLLEGAQRSMPGAWRRRGELVELSLDGTPDGDGIEIEHIVPARVGIHLHVTLDADHAGRFLSALGTMLGGARP